MEQPEKRRLIFHIDVNSAFLSWECVYRLSQDPDALDLRTIPSAVGGDASMRHGIVLAKSPLAKKYGGHHRRTPGPGAPQMPGPDRGAFPF